MEKKEFQQIIKKDLLKIHPSLKDIDDYQKDGINMIK